MLDRRAELHLTDEQVQRLGELEAQQATADESALAQFRRTAPDGGVEERHRPMGEGGGGGGGGGMRGMGGGGGRHRGGSSGSQGGESAQKRGDRLQAMLDDNDTRFYLEAEETLTEEQKAAARKIATRFRADLADRREAMRSQGREP